MKFSTVYTKLQWVVLLFLALQFLCYTFCFAQGSVYFETTIGAGLYGRGTICSFNPATGFNSPVYDFEKGTDGQGPVGNLVYDAINGLFYGMTANGDSVSHGTIYSFNPLTGEENMVWNFESKTDGWWPNGSLVFDSTNLLFYGMTPHGGTDSLGVIFSFNPADNSEKVLWSFHKGTDGQSPMAGLVYDVVNGLFYGTTSAGGSNGKGTIISFNPNTNQENVVWNFGNGMDGTNPSSDLAYQAAYGLFYGTTTNGGSNDTSWRGGGTLFSFNPPNNNETVLWNFGGGKDGASPANPPVYYPADGLFYGTTNEGGTSINNDGTIYSFNPATNKDSVVWNFKGQPDGESPVGSLIYNAANELFYSMTSYGGGSAMNQQTDYGTLFSFNPVNDSEKVIAAFISSAGSGAVPTASLVFYDGTTGINAVSGPSSSIILFPNPTNGQFTLSGLPNRQTLEIYNYAGQKISRTVIENTTQQFDISNHANGIYLVRILNADGTLASSKKVVKAE